MLCKHETCQREHHAHGYCSMHLGRFNRGTDMSQPVRYSGKGKSPEQRYNECSYKLNDYGCVGWKPTNGIRPQMIIDTKSILVTRWAYEHFCGVEVPYNLVLHHTCFEPRCCNPFHLEIQDRVTHLHLHRMIRQYAKYNEHKELLETAEGKRDIMNVLLPYVY